MEPIGYKVGITVAEPPTDFVNTVLKEIGDVDVFGIKVAQVNKINRREANSDWRIDFYMKKEQDAEQFAFNLKMYCSKNDIEMCDEANIHPVWEGDTMIKQNFSIQEEKQNKGTLRQTLDNLYSVIDRLPCKEDYEAEPKIQEIIDSAHNLQKEIDLLEAVSYKNRYFKRDNRYIKILDPYYSKAGDAFCFQLTLAPIIEKPNGKLGGFEFGILPLFKETLLSDKRYIIDSYTEITEECFLEAYDKWCELQRARIKELTIESVEEIFNLGLR